MNMDSWDRSTFKGLKKKTKLKVFLMNSQRNRKLRILSWKQRKETFRRKGMGSMS